MIVCYKLLNILSGADKIKYIIEIRKKRDWSIGLDKRVDKTDNINIDLPFGIYEFADGKIKYIFDISIRKDDIKNVAKLDAFKEVVDFSLFMCDEECGEFKEEKSFRGSFIEALEYIEKIFNSD